MSKHFSWPHLAPNGNTPTSESAVKVSAISAVILRRSGSWGKHLIRVAPKSRVSSSTSSVFRRQYSLLDLSIVELTSALLKVLTPFYA